MNASNNKFVNRYTINQTLCDYAYATLFKATNKETNELVQIKLYKKKFFTWEQCMELREMKLLRNISCPGVIRLKEIIKDKDQLYCVYEWSDETLYQYYQKVRDQGHKLLESEIKLITQQIVQTMAYIHKNDFFHRDLCLENIFINSKGTVKIGNFYNCKDSSARPPYTDYVTTRWYRAPEQLLHSNNYNNKVDIWAIGCIISELFLLGPMFGGTSEVDQLYKILKLLGTPTDWQEFYSLSQHLKIRIPSFEQQSMQRILPNASREAIDLIQNLLYFNPQKRLSCVDILNHPFFTGEKLPVNQIPQQIKSVEKTPNSVRPTNALKNQSYQASNFKIDENEEFKLKQSQQQQQKPQQKNDSLPQDLKIGEEAQNTSDNSLKLPKINQTRPVYRDGKRDTKPQDKLDSSPKQQSVPILIQENPNISKTQPNQVQEEKSKVEENKTIPQNKTTITSIQSPKQSSQFKLSALVDQVIK